MRLTSIKRAGTILASHWWRTGHFMEWEEESWHPMGKTWTQNEYKDRGSGQWRHLWGKLKVTQSLLSPAMKLLLLSLGLTLVCAHEKGNHEVVRSNFNMSQVGLVEHSDFWLWVGWRIMKWGGTTGKQEFFDMLDKGGGFWTWTKRTKRKRWQHLGTFILIGRTMERALHVVSIHLHSNSIFTSPLLVLARRPKIQETSKCSCDIPSLLFLPNHFTNFITDFRGVVFHPLGLR